MYMSELDEDAQFGDGKVGFINLLFGPYESILSRAGFCEKLMSKECEWIFNDQKIRKRMRENFMDLATLEEVGC